MIQKNKTVSHRIADTSNKYNWQRVNIQNVLSLHISEKNKTIQ